MWVPALEERRKKNQEKIMTEKEWPGWNDGAVSSLSDTFSFFQFNWLVSVVCLSKINMQTRHVPVAPVDVRCDAKPQIAQVILRESARHELTTPVHQVQNGRSEHCALLSLTSLQQVKIISPLGHGETSITHEIIMQIEPWERRNLHLFLSPL